MHAKICLIKLSQAAVIITPWRGYVIRKLSSGRLLGPFILKYYIQEYVEPHVAIDTAELSPLIVISGERLVVSM